MDVSIIIVNFNTFKLICDCINSIQKYTHGIKYEIILVDNNSTDFDFIYFYKTFSDVIVINSKTNFGFAKGNNIGIAKAKGKYILLLNSDTLLKENSIRTTFDYLEIHSKAAAVSARLKFPNGKLQSCCQRFPSIRYQLFELFRLHKFVSKKAAGKILLGVFFDQMENIKADWIWGTYFMFRRHLLELLRDKMLNEDYFMYCEDMQWCMDFKRLGYQK
jgi:GT2 family glycosyltransferase